VEKICCGLCEEKFFIPANLDLHVRKKHQRVFKNQPIECILCKKLIRGICSYSKHLSSLHKDEVIRCNFRKCSAIFKTEKTLEEHLKNKHLLIDGKKPIECKVCKFWYQSDFALRVHMKNHKEVANFKCLFCGESFENRIELFHHIKKTHKSEAIRCQQQQCRCYFKTREVMKKHFKKMHNLTISCKFCFSICSNRAVLLKHLKQNHIEKKCKFSFCYFYTGSKDEMEMHVGKKHSKTVKLKKCVYCEKSLRQQSMCYHINIFHSDIAIKCENKKCSEYFKTLGDLEKHKKEAHKNVERHKKTIVCLFCQKEIWDKSTYVGHIKTHHSEEAIRCKYKHCFTFFKSQNALQKHYEQNHVGKYNCALCEYNTSVKGNFRAHFQYHHLPKEFKCPHCPKRFGNNSILGNHVEISHKPHEKCPHCKKVGTNLRRHVVTANCPICSQPFPCKKLLSDHKLKCKKIHKCRHCGKEFKIASDLKQHINLRHKSGQKWKGFKCKFCNNVFGDRKSLRCHQKSEHSDLMKYKCEFCGESFIWRNTFQRHLILAHDFRAHECKLCDRKFAHQSELTFHLQKKHFNKEQPKFGFVECADCGRIMKKHSLAIHYIAVHF